MPYLHTKNHCAGCNLNGRSLKMKHSRPLPSPCYLHLSYQSKSNTRICQGCYKSHFAQKLLNSEKQALRSRKRPHFAIAGTNSGDNQNKQLRIYVETKQPHSNRANTVTLQNQYHFVQNMLLKYYPGTHELQTQQFQINPDHSFVITHNLSFTVNSSTTGAVNSTTLKRSIGTIFAGIQKAQQHYLRFIITPLTLKRFERSNHANLLILDRRYNTMTWFEPHGTDPMMSGHPSHFYQYYNASVLGIEISNLLVKVNEARGTRYNLIQPRCIGSVWGQSITADSFCSFWCLLFFEQTVRGKQHQWIKELGSKKKEDLMKYIEDKLMNCSSLFRELMKENNRA